MILELHFENKRPDIYVGGVGLFHHLWLHVKLSYYELLLKMLDEMDETDNGEKA